MVVFIIGIIPSVITIVFVLLIMVGVFCLEGDTNIGDEPREEGRGPDAHRGDR